ncbi:MAG: ATP-binding cassette domain-containing protein, partial [Bacteroidales bacterium]|nr:ATP-binding cassette domain-containing protein [Bacteroidales bacterium]
MIRVNNISKSFAEKQVLFNLSAEFQPGEVSQIIGKSGSGKTVFLKSIVGLHDIDSGEVWFGDREYSNADFKTKREIRQEIGLVFQGGALFTSLSVEENVMLPLNMFSKLSKKEKIDRVNFCLNRVNMENANKLFPAEISGGMQKRVAIARAIVLNPKYLFCDEPNSGLDPQTSIVIDNLIRELTIEYNITTIMNTHDMNSIMEIGDQIIFVYEGKNWWQGSKNDIFNSDNEELNEFVFASKLYKKIQQASR